MDLFQAMRIEKKIKYFVFELELVSKGVYGSVVSGCACSTYTGAHSAASRRFKVVSQAAKADVPADDKTAFRQFAALFTPGEHKFAVYDFEATLEVGLKVRRLILVKWCVLVSGSRTCDISLPSA